MEKEIRTTRFLKVRTVVSMLVIFCFFAGLSGTAHSAPKGEIRIAMASLGNETMDPVLTSNSGKPMMTPFYDYIIGVDSNGKLSKDTGVARDWKLASDSMSLTIYVRPGIKFHNGDDVTAADVKFSLEQFISPRCVSSQAGQMRKIIKSVETTDRMTAVVHFKKPSAVLANFLSRQMGVEGCVLPKNYFEKHGAEYFNTHPVGSGPFKFLEHKVGAHIKYEAVDNHWRIGTPTIKYFTYYYVKEESTRIAMLRTGEVDIAGVSRDRIKEVPKHKPYEKTSGDVVALYVNNTWDKNTYLSNPKFREALSISINREEIRDFILGGKAQISGSGLVYGSYALDYKPLPLHPYDPERAKKLVKEAFPGETPELKMYTYPRPGVPELARIGEAVTGYWEKIGVKSKIIPTEYPTYRKMLAKKNSPKLANSVASMMFGNRLLWDAAFNIVYHSNGLLSCVQDPEIDKMIEDLIAEKDPTKIGPRFYNLAMHLNKNFYQIPLVEVGAVYAADPKKVPSWTHLSAPLSYDLYLDDLYTR
jgi:peptide/nickel transport system substrate-binding protein